MNDETEFIQGIAADPKAEEPRQRYAAWLDANARPEWAAMMRGTATETDRVDIARWLETYAKCEGLKLFALMQIGAEKETGEQQQRLQAAACREYAMLERDWRRWLPTEVTTLSPRTVDSCAYIRDYIHPAIVFPTRRRGGWRTHYCRPMMEVHFRLGLPSEVTCEPIDYRRAGVALLTWFPWLEVKLRGPEF